MVTCLRNLGVEAEIINYHPDYVEGGGGFKLPTSKKNIRANLVIAYQKLTKLYSLLRNNHGPKEKFAAFRQHYLHVSNNNYKSLAELRNAAPAYDVYVCGSDQIWNPSEEFGVLKSVY